MHLAEQVTIKLSIIKPNYDETIVSYSNRWHSVIGKCASTYVGLISKNIFPDFAQLTGRSVYLLYSLFKGITIAAQ
jgi:hypothetical protein